MSLFDPERQPDLSPEDAIVVVHRFLHRCRTWATDREIPERLARLAEDPTPERAAKLHAWTSYLAFTEHALAELESGTLDHWFRLD